MTKAIVKNAADFKSLREKLDFPAWVRSPLTYPCVFIWAWAGDNDVFQCQYIFPGDFKTGDERADKLERIVEVVAKACGHDAGVVIGPSQHRTFSDARAIICHEARKRAYTFKEISDARAIICHEARKRAYTFKEIGGAINRTHKSVYNMLNSYSAAYKYEDEFRALADSCTKALLAVGL